jgi:hypothetical protein
MVLGGVCRRPVLRGGFWRDGRLGGRENTLGSCGRCQGAWRRHWSFKWPAGAGSSPRRHGLRVGRRWLDRWEGLGAVKTGHDAFMEGHAYRGRAMQRGQARTTVVRRRAGGQHRTTASRRPRARAGLPPRRACVSGASSCIGKARGGAWVEVRRGMARRRRRRGARARTARRRPAENCRVTLFRLSFLQEIE